MPPKDRKQPKETIELWQRIAKQERKLKLETEGQRDALLDACEQWPQISEKIKDRLTGDACGEIGLYAFDALIEEALK